MGKKSWQIDNLPRYYYDVSQCIQFAEKELQQDLDN